MKLQSLRLNSSCLLVNKEDLTTNLQRINDATQCYQVKLISHDVHALNQFA